MFSKNPSLAICDANILIDYVAVDDYILKELASYWKEVHVPDIVLMEVPELSQERAVELGLIILPTPLKELEKIPGLSYQDSACYFYVKKENAVCLSNDKKLRKVCKNIGKRVVWGLEMLLLLVEDNIITKERAKDIARKIESSNPEITEELLNEFLKKLKSR